MTENRKFVIRENRQIARDTYSLVLEAVEDGFKFSGEFVDIALDGFFLRRPISVCDSWPGGIRLIYKTVGKGTEKLGKMNVGDMLDVLTGLGKSFNTEECMKGALLIGGGLGCAPLLPICKKLKEEGKKVYAVLGFNTEDEIVLTEEYGNVCDRLTIATMDGSIGVKGTVLDAIDANRPDFDYFYCCGPLIMMKAVCQNLTEPGEVSLEERMGCGSGFCYGCSVKTVSGVRRVCADGPVFQKEEVIWQ